MTGAKGKEALIGARAARGLDEDRAPLTAALSECGLEPDVLGVPTVPSEFIEPGEDPAARFALEIARLP